MFALWPCLVTMSPASCQQADPNLTPNPGFEQADGAAPAFWHQRTPTDSERELAWVTEAPHSGQRCIRIINHTDTRSRWRTGHLRDVRLRPGTEAELSGWVRHAGGDGTAYFRLYSMGASGSIVEQPASTTVTGDAPWTRVTLRARVPRDAAFCMIYCEKDGPGTGWYDDIELRGEASDGDPAPQPVPPIVYGPDDFDRLENLHAIRWADQRVLQPQPPDALGHAEIWFSADSARYNVTVRYAQKPVGATDVSLAINGQQVAPFATAAGEPAQTAGLTWTDALARGVDIQHHSRVVLAISPGEGAQCRIAGLQFAPVARFGGQFLPAEAVTLPPTLFCCPTSLERKALRSQLHTYISSHFVEPLQKRREADLAALKTPDDWRRRQQETRAMLPQILGEFGPKCPLNPQLVGKIERDGYAIERLIIETQPSYHVPCNFYIPKNRKLPAPGVLFTCGHSGEGKGYHLYHECCLGLVLKGYCVLAVEPMGQGERSEYFDPETGKPTVPLTVSQHHQLLRPSWLVGRSLAGHRTWDMHRACDYLVSRPEVDPEQLAVVGNSGGGQMALLTIAYDERVDVCAAAHPGGSCENVYLTGSNLFDRRLLSLIAPRPCRFIVGRDSGEEAGHRAKYEDMLRFYRGLGADEERLSFMLVDGVHNMEQPKREAAYEWLNRWFGKDEEGSAEPELKPEPVEALWCTESGLTLKSLDGESGQTMISKLADDIRPEQTPPKTPEETSAAVVRLRKAVAERIGGRGSGALPPPLARPAGEVTWDGIAVRKFFIAAETGIELPALLLMPAGADPARPIILHAPDAGKPSSMDESALPLELARLGYRVLSVDVRGIGEADPSPEPPPSPSRGYNPAQWSRDVAAINCAYGHTSMLAMRAFDVTRAIDWLRSEDEFAGARVAVVGEGLGGVWAMVATAFDDRVAAVVCRRTLISYKALLSTQYYEVQGYFWVPGALQDYDLPDLPSLAAPRPVLWLDAVDPVLQPAPEDAVRDALGWSRSVFAAMDVLDRLGIKTSTDPGDNVEAAGALRGFVAGGP